MIAPTARPAVVRVASAAFCVWPVTSGTCTCAGPLETNTVTGLPTCTTIPADGSVETTWPCATFALDCSCVVGLKPALRSLLSAVRRGEPFDGRQRGGAGTGGDEDAHARPLPHFAAARRRLADHHAAGDRGARGRSRRPGRGSRRAGRASATASVWPTTLGTVTLPPEDASSRPSAHQRGDEQQHRSPTAASAARAVRHPRAGGRSHRRARRPAAAAARRTPGTARPRPVPCPAARA